MAKSDIDTAVAAGNTQGRSVEGPGVSFTNASGAASANTKAVPRGNTQAGDPSAEAKGVRAPMMAERNGAAHTIITNIVKQNEPAAGATLANARVIPSATPRSFESGIDSSY